MITVHKFNCCNVLGKVYPPGKIYLNYSWAEKKQNEWITFDECECNVWYEDILPINMKNEFLLNNRYYLTMFLNNKTRQRGVRKDGSWSNEGNIDNTEREFWRGFVYRRVD